MLRATILVSFVALAAAAPLIEDKPNEHSFSNTSRPGWPAEWVIDPNFKLPDTQRWLVDPPNATVDLLDASIDWRQKGAVTPVKSQCGGTCWSFSATGNMEGAYAAGGGSLVSLSEQYLQDGCAQGSTGPYGIPVKGDPGTDGKVSSEAQYPTYVGSDPNCGHKTCPPSPPTQLQVNAVQCLPNGGPESDILNWLQKSPVGISVDASAFSGYTTGILGRDGGNCNTQKLDHAVLIVGYGTDTDGTNYWIMKNSWGTGFGENGFWRMKYGVNCMGLAGGGPCQVKSISNAGGPPSPPSPPTPPPPPTPPSPPSPQPACANTQCRTSGGGCPPGTQGVACTGLCSAQCGGGVMGCGCM